MSSALERLLEISSGPLADQPVTGLPGGPLGDELAGLLQRRNGFVAFESALVVRAAAPGDGGLARWNAVDTWRDTYGDLADGLYCFAEDAYGGQFAIDATGIVGFDPETGERTRLASSLEEWAAAILADHDYLTGYTVAHEWQLEHGPLRPGHRLVPLTPFVLGGAYAARNLVAKPDVDGMRARGPVAVQLADLPDGAEVEIRVIDD